MSQTNLKPSVYKRELHKTSFSENMYTNSVANNLFDFFRYIDLRSQFNVSRLNNIYGQEIEYIGLQFKIDFDLTAEKLCVNLYKLNDNNKFARMSFNLSPSNLTYETKEDNYEEETQLDTNITTHVAHKIVMQKTVGKITIKLESDTTAKLIFNFTKNNIDEIFNSGMTQSNNNVEMIVNNVPLENILQHIIVIYIFIVSKLIKDTAININKSNSQVYSFIILYPELQQYYITNNLIQKSIQFSQALKNNTGLNEINIDLQVNLEDNKPLNLLTDSTINNQNMLRLKYLKYKAKYINLKNKNKFN